MAVTEIEWWISERLRELAGLPSRSLGWRDFEQTVEELDLRLAAIGEVALADLADAVVERGPVFDANLALALIEAAGEALLQDLAAWRCRADGDHRGVLGDLAVGVAANVTVIGGAGAWHKACQALRDRRMTGVTRGHAKAMEALGRAAGQAPGDGDRPEAQESAIDGGSVT